MRAGHARPTYFLGEVSQARRWAYFPVLYAVKETLPFHLLTALALVLALRRLGSSAWGLQPLTGWLRSHPADTLMLGWLLLYWSVALRAHLYLGVRHLLPVFPFTILLVAREITPWLTRARAPIVRGRRPSAVKPVAVALLLLWQGLSVARAYPAFLAYFNEAGGGPGGGAWYAVDSNLDWGQDLRRLRAFADAHQLERLALDYFGTASPRHELGARYLPWRSALGPYTGWLAVSATTFHTAQGQRDATVPYRPEEAYAWLRGHTPVAAIGGSILVFDLRALRGSGAPAAHTWPSEQAADTRGFCSGAGRDP